MINAKGLLELTRNRIAACTMLLIMKNRSVLDVAMEMAHRRTDAALLTKRGTVVGIVTDHDLTRLVSCITFFKIVELLCLVACTDKA